jgi:predicted acylesterase/phospholipase RssA
MTVLDDVADDDTTARFCDVIMKGGVTSGVVYPKAIRQLAKKYVLKNIGGTSVGAIAAAVAAAAEYRRRQTGLDDGYAELENLAAFLGQEGTLQRLFAADRSSKDLLAVALKLVGTAKPPAKFLAFFLALAWTYAWIPAGLLLLNGLIFWLVGQPTTSGAWLRCGVGAVAVAGSLTPLLLVLWYLYRQTVELSRPDADFGWCHGFDPQRSPAFAALVKTKSPTELSVSETPPLTDWLDALIARAADPKRDRENPLTFNDLWNATSPPWHKLEDGEHSIEFKMVTTCVTLGRPFEIPFTASDSEKSIDPETDYLQPSACKRPPFFFVAADMRRYFPEHIVQHMMAKAESQKYPGYHRFPAADALPVVVAARLSMSFPVLFSAVKLYGVDPEGTMRPIWFSDGGLTSNFPIYLFDAPMPRWPTFAIDLLGGDPSAGSRKAHRQSEYNADEVFLESEIPANKVNPWNQFNAGKTANVLAFILAIIDSMRTWQDTLLGSLPGNATRTVGIRLSQSEGGLNLNMPSTTIRSLIARGADAGDLLCNSFASAPDAEAWQLQRHVRFAATMASFESWLVDFRTAFQPVSGQRSYAAMVDDSPWNPPSLAQIASQSTSDVADLADKWKEHPGLFESVAPQPNAALRLRPLV